TKLSEFGFVRIGLCDELIRNVKFQVVAIRTNDGFGEADGFIAASPVESGLEDHFFLGITLRFVEAGGGLGFAENVGGAVIADAVAGAEIGVGGVVGGKPYGAAGMRRMGQRGN